MPDEAMNPIEENKEEGTTTTVDLNDAAALKKLWEDERAKSAEYLDNWRRAAADLSNYRKRMERDFTDLVKTANGVLLLRLLPVLDDFDRAEQTMPENLRQLTWIEGVLLIAHKLRAIIDAEGIKPIEALNQAFDPNLHEAVIQEESDQVEDGKVLAELQKGYKMNDKVLRPTLVKVAKKKG